MLALPFVRRLLALCALTLCAVPSIGCIEATAEKRRLPFEVVELDACLVILVDMSSSFRDRWSRDAHQVFIALSQQYFQDSFGSNRRLVIAQLSADDRTVIFEGHPNELMSRFDGPEELGAFLQSSSDPSGSQVYEAARRAIDYTRSIDGVTGRTQLMTVILSDMQDSQRNRTQRIATGRKLLDSLTAYRKSGGGLALYYVASNEMPRWRQILERAGFEPGQFVIESELTENPRLPELH